MNISLAALTELKDRLVTEADEQVEVSQPYRIATIQDATHAAFTAYLDNDLVRILTRCIELEEKEGAALPDEESEAHRLEMLSIAHATLAAHEAVASVMRPIIERLTVQVVQEEQKQRAVAAVTPKEGTVKVGMN